MFQDAGLDSYFTVYLANSLDTLRQAVYQVGFSLANRLRLPGVVAVDAPARNVDFTMTRLVLR